MFRKQVLSRFSEVAGSRMIRISIVLTFSNATSKILTWNDAWPCLSKGVVANGSMFDDSVMRTLIAVSAKPN
jgi:hypothetical protein